MTREEIEETFRVAVNHARDEYEDAVKEAKRLHDRSVRLAERERAEALDYLSRRFVAWVS